MLSSKFTAWVVLILVLVIVSIPLFGYITINMTNTFNKKTPLIVEVLFLTLFWFVPIWLIFGEVRTKTIKIDIHQDYVLKRSFLNCWKPWRYEYEKFDGYKISWISSKTGTYEYLYLLIDGRKVIKISEFYHSNYKYLKTALIRKEIKNLGIERWSFINELKELFIF